MWRFHAVHMPAHVLPCLWALLASIHWWISMILQDWAASVWPEVLFCWDCSLMRHRDPHLHRLKSNATPPPGLLVHTKHAQYRCLQHELLISYRVRFQLSSTFFSSIHYKVEIWELLKIIRKTSTMLKVCYCTCLPRLKEPRKQFNISLRRRPTCNLRCLKSSV